MNDMLFSVCAILVPLVVVLIFGLMTISNIRHFRNRIHSINVSGVCHPIVSNKRQRRLTKIDRRLLIMLFVEFILLALLTIPSSIEKFYSTLTSNLVKSSFDAVIENIIYNFALLLTYLANGMQFYVYTLSGGTIFRKAFFDLMRVICRKLFRQ